MGHRSFGLFGTSFSETELIGLLLNFFDFVILEFFSNAFAQSIIICLRLLSFIMGMFLLNGGNGKIIKFGFEIRIDGVVEIGLRLFLKVEIVDSSDVSFFSRGLIGVGNVVLVIVDFGVGIIIAIGFFFVVHLGWE